jgi:hypothetical protein
MMMSAAQITFKDQLFSIDDDVQRPFLEAMYHWNMQFNPRPEIKGDMTISVKGTSSLTAREIRAQNLDQFANSTMNQFDAPFIDRHALNVQRAKVLELGDDIILDKDQALLLQMRQMLANGTDNAQPTSSTAVNPPNPTGPSGYAAQLGGASGGEVAGPPDDSGQGQPDQIANLGGDPQAAGNGLYN